MKKKKNSMSPVMDAQRGSRSSSGFGASNYRANKRLAPMIHAVGAISAMSLRAEVEIQRDMSYQGKPKPYP